MIDLVSPVEVAKMIQLKLRPAAAADAPLIAAIHVASWRDAYAAILSPDYLSGPIEMERLDLWSSRMREPDPGQIVQVAENEDGAVIGLFVLSATSIRSGGAS